MNRQTHKRSRPVEQTNRRPKKQLLPMRTLSAQRRWQEYKAKLNTGNGDAWYDLLMSRGPNLVGALSNEQRDALEQRAQTIVVDNRHNQFGPAPPESDIVEMMYELAIEDDFMARSLNNNNVVNINGANARGGKSRKQRSKRKY